MSKIFQSFFKFAENHTSFQIELIAGLTSFLTMAYVIVVSPGILMGAGMNPSAVFVATCLAAAFGSIAMGLLGRYPIGLAPSMGLNAYFTYIVVQDLKYPWQIALGAVLCAGIVFLLLTACGIRQWIIYIIPNSLKKGIAAGIGLFLGVIALKNIGVITTQPHLIFHISAISHLPVWLALAGLGTIYLLDRFRIHGAILLGIIVVAAVGILLGISKFYGIFSLPPSIKPTLLALQLPHAIDTKLLMVIFTFFFVALFDSTGTLIAILQQANLIKSDGNIPRLTSVLFADSIATIVGALLGTSTTGSYIESSAGVKAGGRTGLTAIIIGIMFLLALFLFPLAESIPAYATAPALMFVAILMAQNLKHLEWRNISESLAAVITAISIPLTFSIADGICLGFITYVILNILTGKMRQLHPLLGGLSVIFLIFLIYQWY